MGGKKRRCGHTLTLLIIKHHFNGRIYIDKKYLHEISTERIDSVYRGGGMNDYGIKRFKTTFYVALLRIRND